MSAFVFFAVGCNSQLFLVLLKTAYVFSPSIPLIMLLVFIVIGVILVTVSIDAVGADIINHIHFMGRQVSKAKSIAEKVYLVRVCFISTSIDIW